MMAGAQPRMGRADGPIPVPGLAVLLVVLLVVLPLQMPGDGLRDALDPMPQRLL